MSQDAIKLPVDVGCILHLLPHRYPFLLVDRVVELVGKLKPGDPAREWCDIGGITLRKPRNTGAEIIDLRIGAKLNGTRIMARGTSTHADHRPATPRAAVQASKIRLLINKLTR